MLTLSDSLVSVNQDGTTPTVMQELTTIQSYTADGESCSLGKSVVSMSFFKSINTSSCCVSFPISLQNFTLTPTTANTLPSTRLDILQLHFVFRALCADGCAPNLLSSTHSGLSTAAIVGIGVGSVGLIISVFLAILCCRQRSPAKSAESQLVPTASLESARAGPRAYGEVYSGVFNGQQVAIKMLLPATRTNLQHVNEFLAEAKMTATMDHPHVVSFIGVAWDSLSDLCVVLEFMDGGDLRSLLNQYEEKRQLVGFNRQ
ncbi:unnamed protein product [Phytophthora lilii]|uniref:Unnamed protein product n=1 Tax=Phytophthora lilii TaxID=2077276 RepID=A0A9W6TUC4_9STRA|nr:unnamed protein product [Phytophthora lilii]